MRSLRTRIVISGLAFMVGLLAVIGASTVVAAFYCTEAGRTCTVQGGR